MTLRDQYISEHLYDIGDIVDDIQNGYRSYCKKRNKLCNIRRQLMKTYINVWLYNIMETPVYPIRIRRKSKRASI
jgi:hypothetical protein